MIDPRLDRRFPDAAALETAAARRLPGFLRDYLEGGIGPETALRRNRAALDAVRLAPRYLVDDSAPHMAVDVAGTEWRAPFGVAPLGLGGLIWPGAEAMIARAAATAEIGHVLSTFATSALEDIAPIAGWGAAFQLYPPADPGMEADLIARARAAGYRVLMVTVDIPGPTRRRRDIRNGLSVPPRLSPRGLGQIMAAPAWALGAARHGVPGFGTLAPYFPGTDMAAAAEFLDRMMQGHIGPDRLARIRAAWPGALIIKGVLGVADAALAMELGADGVVVSNHGGRQLDAAPTAPEVLPAIRDRLGANALVLADGGVRSGLDIARMIALGADAVLIGRPFLQAAAAMGPPGPLHLAQLLQAELQTTMIQLGVARLSELRGTLWRPDV
ncbi:alpha-hydroxy-acid oxidizing protein [Rhodobacteraceae bacterium 2376]|uniref:Alpha-hydroxy-acid oxidizing protein n=1 Tax=Rhabdonatronobacter sediminivivens TaxID=2743469 RepID=A0A7Z0KY69_9RHOB|nr:alpha-hydroxy-acid oxidizing protein [Rhabdonatronobacter sediminivivens]NYS25447.1 alpha-hydroxy-acid oxidizing protein [Rhabdonatronobacter sediminivivens]